MNVPIKKYKEFSTLDDLENMFKQTSESNYFKDVVPQVNKEARAIMSKENENNARNGGQVSNEISTQTSFVVHAEQECQQGRLTSRRASFTTSNKQFDKIQKQKFKQLIEVQKHEKRQLKFQLNTNQTNI